MDNSIKENLNKDYLKLNDNQKDFKGQIFLQYTNVSDIFLTKHRLFISGNNINDLSSNDINIAKNALNKLPLSQDDKNNLFNDIQNRDAVILDNYLKIYHNNSDFDTLPNYIYKLNNVYINELSKEIIFAILEKLRKNNINNKADMKKQFNDDFKFIDRHFRIYDDILNDNLINTILNTDFNDPTLVNKFKIIY